MLRTAFGTATTQKDIVNVAYRWDSFLGLPPTPQLGESSSAGGTDRGHGTGTHVTAKWTEPRRRSLGPKRFLVCYP